MRARRALLLLVVIALLVGIGPAAWSQKVPRATCLDCHEEEGMKYAVIQATPYIQIPAGQTQTMDVTVANPWLHEITGSLVTVQLGNGSSVAFDTPDPLNISESLILSPTPGENRTKVPFRVQPGATGVTVTMRQPEDASGTGAQDVDTVLHVPEGDPSRAPADGRPMGPDDLAGVGRPANTVEKYTFEGENLATKGTGTWNLSVFLAENEGIGVGAPETEVDVEVHVYYNSTRSQSRLLAETIGPGGSGQVPFQLKGVSQGPANLGISVQVTSYYLHPTGIGAQDEGNHTMEGSLNFTVGDRLELGDAGPPVPPTPPINWKLNARIWGEATGFIGLFMVPLSLFLGGAFGRRNVLWVNKITRSARLRVLWHNSLSFALLAISLLHLVLFLYEGVYDWSVGMVWGGIGTLGLIGLAITGGFQRRFARSIGYANWRLLHIAMAVVFVASVLVHVLVDGAHFDIFRDWFRLTSTV